MSLETRLDGIRVACTAQRYKVYSEARHIEFSGTYSQVNSHRLAILDLHLAAQISRAVSKVGFGICIQTFIAHVSSVKITSQ